MVRANNSDCRSGQVVSMNNFENRLIVIGYNNRLFTVTLSFKSKSTESCITYNVEENESKPLFPFSTNKRLVILLCFTQKSVLLKS